MNSQTGVRQGTADLAKGIAVLLMIQVHLMEVFAKPEIYKSWLGTTSLFLGGPPVAPVFMIILGYYLGKTRRTIAGLLLRGAVLLVVALLLNIGLNFHLLLRIYASKILANPWEYVFGVDILFLASLSIFVVALLRPVFMRRRYSAILLAAIIVGLSNFATDLLTVNDGTRYLLAFAGGHYSWSYFPLFPWLAYPFLGFAYSNLQESDVASKMSKQLKIVCLFVALFILALSGRFAVSIATDLPAYYHQSPIFFGWTILFLCTWFAMLSLLDKGFGNGRLFRFVKWIGKNVLVLYIIQWLIIGNVGTALYRTQDFRHLLGWYAAIVVSTCVLSVVVQRLLAIIQRSDQCRMSAHDNYMKRRTRDA
ncbi:MAG: acyltransferase [bacterium]|nr:acyltransferase [bacterium]